MQAERLAAFVHVVFGVSKDFCASGFRVGAVYTRNAAFLECVSHPPGKQARAAWGHTYPMHSKPR